MRLYLSSYRFGNDIEKLLSMVGENKRVAVIANAQDDSLTDGRKERLERELSDLRQLGFEPTEIDLRDYFETPFTHKDLIGYGLVWVRGGNAFTLRRAMRSSGFDTVITEQLQRDEIVYGGYSAGVCVLAPNLHGIELCDDPGEVPKGYDPDIIWDGLRLVPFAIAPHYKSDNPESLLIDRVVTYFEHNNIPYETLRDGETIIVDKR